LRSSERSRAEFLYFFSDIIDEIKNNFRWEYPVGIPSYGTGRKKVAVDIVYTVSDKKWIAIEIEMIGAGKEFKSELMRCIYKLKTAPECRKQRYLAALKQNLNR